MEEKEIKYELVEIIEIKNRKYAIIAEEGNTDEAMVMRVVEKNGQKDFASVTEDEFNAVMEKYEEKFVNNLDEEVTIETEE